MTISNLSLKACPKSPWRQTSPGWKKKKAVKKRAVDCNKSKPGQRNLVQNNQVIRYEKKTNINNAFKKLIFWTMVATSLEENLPIWFDFSCKSNCPVWQKSWTFLATVLLQNAGPLVPVIEDKFLELVHFYYFQFLENFNV